MRAISAPPWLAAAACAASLAACSTSNYCGIDLRPGRAKPELQALAERARAGEKQAQLELGVRLEEGRGVTVDLARAASLYAKAAEDEGGIVHVYSPRVGNNPAQVIALNRGIRQPGLSTARVRLQRLREDQR